MASKGSALRFIAARFGFTVEDGKLKNLNKKVGDSAKRMRIATRETRKFKRELRSLTSMARVVIGGYIGYKAVGALTAFADEADEAAKKSKAAGMSAQQWQTLGYATERAGGDVKILAKAFQRLGRNMNDADSGSKKAKDGFKLLNVEFKKGDKLRSTYDVFLDISKAYQGLDDETRKVALSQDLMGRSGAELMILLEEGPEKIKAYQRRFERLGYVLDKKAAAEGEKFKDSMLDLTVILKGLRNRIALSILPTITKFAENLATWWATGNNATKAMTRLKNAAKQAGIVLSAFISVKILKALVSLKTALYHGARAMIAFGKANWIAYGKMALWGVVIVAAVVAIQDLIVFAKGGRSEIGKMLGDSTYSQGLRSDLLAVGAGLKSLWEVVKPLARQILPAILKLFLFIVKAVSVFLVGLHQVIKGIIWFFKELYQGWVWLKNGVSQFVESLKSDLLSLWGYIKQGFVGLIGVVLAPFNAIVGAYEKIKKTFGIGGKKFDFGMDGDFFSSFRKKPIYTSGAQGVTKSIGIQNPSINVTVTGAPQMTTGEVTETVRGGVKKGLTDMINQSWGDFSPSEAG